MSQNKVKVIDVNSEKTLFECDIKEIEQAYRYAAELEEMGLDIKIMAPTITQTLTDSLGMNHDEKEEYQQSVTAEIEDHEGHDSSCCHEPPKKIQ